MYMPYAPYPPPPPPPATHQGRRDEEYGNVQYMSLPPLPLPQWRAASGIYGIPPHMMGYPTQNRQPYRQSEIPVAQSVPMGKNSPAEIGPSKMWQQQYPPKGGNEIRIYPHRDQSGAFYGMPSPQMYPPYPPQMMQSYHPHPYEMGYPVSFYPSPEPKPQREKEKKKMSPWYPCFKFVLPALVGSLMILLVLVCIVLALVAAKGPSVLQFMPGSGLKSSEVENNDVSDGVTIEKIPIPTSTDDYGNVFSQFGDDAKHIPETDDAVMGELGLGAVDDMMAESLSYIGQDESEGQVVSDVFPNDDDYYLAEANPFGNDDVAATLKNLQLDTMLLFWT